MKDKDSCVGAFSELIEAEGLRVGYLRGTSRSLVIKVGQGESIYGDGGKYLRLAELLRESYGISVFVFEMQGSSEEAYNADIDLVTSKNENNSCQIYYLGISKGALMGCWYAAFDERISAVAAVNAPLTLNFHRRTLPAIKAHGRGRLRLVYGSLDESVGYLPFIEPYTEATIVAGADHNFEGCEAELLKVAEELILR